MKAQGLLLGLLLLSLALPAQAIPLQTKLTVQDLERIERLIELAQRQSPDVKEAKAELGLAAFNEVIILGLSTGLNRNTTNEIDAEPVQESAVGVELSVDLVRVISAVQGYPARRARVAHAKRQIRVAVVEAYAEYVLAKQTKSIAQVRLQGQQQTVSVEIASDEGLTAATELLSADSNERIALEKLAAVVGRSPTDLLELLR
jgi:outer membrane protein TolC